MTESFQIANLQLKIFNLQSVQFYSMPKSVGTAVFFVLFGMLSVPAAVAQDASAVGDTLALDEALQVALERNYEAQIARNDVRIAENDRSLGNAGFWPTLSSSAGYSETISNTQQQFLGGETQDVTGATSTNRNASASLNWTLFDGLSRFATYNRLEVELNQEQARRRERIENVLSRVIMTYYDVARQQQQLRVLREGVSISEERLRIAELRRELGSASDLEVRQARVDLNADRAAALRQEATLKSTKATLNQLLARSPAATGYGVPGRISLDRSLQQRTLVQTAEQQSPLLQQARRSLQAAEAEQREIRAERFPQVDASVGYGYSKLAAESGFLQSSQNYDFTYGLSLTFDIFDGMNRRRRRQNAAVRTQNAELAVDNVRIRLHADVVSAYEDYQNRLDLVELEQDNLEAAEANVDLALEQFRLGEITSVELREVQEQRIQAESRLLTAQFEAKQAEITLLRLSGQLLNRVRSNNL